jgi:uroporphyrinogen-III decarboxylase
MSELNKLLDEYGKLFASDENKRRLGLWEVPETGIRWENQWHGVPGYTADAGRTMPVTAECLDKIWEDVLGLDMKRYFTDPEYYLEYYLKMRIKKFQDLPDDTPLTLDIPLVFGVTHETGLLGQKVYLDTGEEPTFSRESMVDENSELTSDFDFEKTDYLNMVIDFYKRLKDLAGNDFRVIFPQWYRAPQGTALYIRGFQEFSLDLYMNEDFVHRLLRYVTEAAKAFSLWRRDFTGEPLEKCDLFNDDIPLMSPEMYEKYFFPYEKELCDFFGGVYYWHSCGDATGHIPGIQNLPDIELLDLGVSIEDKEKAIGLLDKKQPAEIRVMAQRHVQNGTEEEKKNHIRNILRSCRKAELMKYVFRSSGMSVIHGGREDLRLLARWVELVREVQGE